MASVLRQRNVGERSSSPESFSSEENDMSTFTPPTFTVRCFSSVGLRCQGIAFRVIYFQSPIAEAALHFLQMKELLDAIPKHCFERSAIRSSAYVVMDFAFIAALGTAAYHISTYLGQNGSILNGNAGMVAKWAAWAAYCMSFSEL